jgi:hypothetical protein
MRVDVLFRKKNYKKIKKIFAKSEFKKEEQKFGFKKEEQKFGFRRSFLNYIIFIIR